MTHDVTPPRRVSFPLGQLLMTHNAMDALPREEVEQALARHSAGDWGDVGEEDHHFNEQALKRGSRLLSVYHTRDGVRFWIITEADRLSTTILLPQDY